MSLTSGLTGSSPVGPPTAAAAAAALSSAALLNSSISRMEDHLLTRFHHIDPELVEEYMSGRRRQVSLFQHTNLKICINLHKFALFTFKNLHKY
jgi:hypothetical protein